VKPVPHVTVTDRDSARDILLKAPSDYAAVLSISDVGDEAPAGFREFTGLKLALNFDDVTNTKYGYTPADISDVEKIVAFARAVNGRTLVHCAAGVSRSTAAALAIPALRFEASEDNAKKLCRWLVDVRFCAKPNPHVLVMIDSITGWRGMLARAARERFGV
jgi:predicted protein tyrosine phosphatase